MRRLAIRPQGSFQAGDNGAFWAELRPRSCRALRYHWKRSAVEYLWFFAVDGAKCETHDGNDDETVEFYRYS